jgi:hydrogenase maturation protein HypF
MADLQRLYRFAPDRLAHDMHPDYFSTRWVQSQKLPALAVQHHHAHIAAGMMEHGLLDRRVLGVAWDGTGYGTDGAIWGGEFLAATSTGFDRVATLRPFSLPGGEVAIREPWRCAVAVVGQLAESIDLSTWPGWTIGAELLDAVRRIAERPRLSPVTTSAGRLVDAAAALVLGVERAEFDGQLAMRLEAIADSTARGEYDLPLTSGRPVELDWRPLFAQLVADFQRNVEPSVLAMRFHRSLARGIVRVARHFPELSLVLSGGVFQNRLLTELVAEYYDNHEAPLGLPGLIPPNDGGLAAGQLAVASAHSTLSPCV